MRGVVALSLLAAAASAAPVSDLVPAVQVYVSGTAKAETIPYQYGLMFEDINHSGDGGIYAELLQNRAFQAVSFSEATIDPWFSVGGANLALTNSTPLSAALPNTIVVSAPNGTTGRIGLGNPGYWGIDVRPQTYTGSFYVRGSYNGVFYINLQSNLTSSVYASTTVYAVSTTGSWTQVEYTLDPAAAAPNSNNTLTISFDSASASSGALSFGLLSLFPPTFMNRPNGLRPELAEALSQLSGSYFRFPGGNNIEGNGPGTGSSRWIWNNTIGPLIDRPGRLGTWGYYNTDGLGLHEYFQWCEDLDLQAVYAVWDGLYLNGDIVSQADLQPYIDEALNAIEYITGDTSTYYGSLRAANGHPEPWVLNYVEIGNEDFLNGGPATYLAYRYSMFNDAIQAAYPDITTFSSYVIPTQPSGDYNDYHIYTWPDDFVSRYHQSDYASTANPAMVGEYACVGNNTPADGAINFGDLNLYPYWIGTVSEAVYLLGLEVNAATIFGASYAPTLQNINSYEWGTNMISFQADTTKTYLSTSWHMVKLLSNTRFTQTREVTASLAAGPVYWAAGINEVTDSYILKLATYNTTDANPVAMEVTFPGVKKGVSANLTILTTDDPFAHSYVGVDPVISTTTTIKAGVEGVFSFSLPNYAIAVLATLPAEKKVYKGTTGDETGFAGYGGYSGCKGGRARTTSGNGC